MYQMAYENLNIPRGEEEEREQDCDNIIREYGFSQTKLLQVTNPFFAEFNPAVGRMDTLLRRSGNFVASYCLCHTVKAVRVRVAFQ